MRKFLLLLITWSALAVAQTPVLDEVKPNGMKVRMTVHKDENHNSVRIPALSAGLYWVYGPP